MKKTLLLACIFYFSIYQAQVYHEQDKEGLRVLLRQNSGNENITNLEELGLTIQDTLDWYNSEKWIDNQLSSIINWNGEQPQRVEMIEFYSKIGGNFDGKYFPDLFYLNISDSNIDSIDLSQNNNLQNIICENNSIKNIKLPVENSVLNNLTLRYNSIKEIDLSSSLNLETLVCSSNLLNQLDVSDLNKLLELDCSDNLITELKLPEANDSNLLSLDCYNNKIKILNTHKSPNLIIIYCENNKINKLNILENSNLTELYCRNNELNELNLNNNINLKELDCADNKLTNLNIENNKNIDNLNIQNNLLTFSQLPILKPPKQDSLVNISYSYAPQKTIFYGDIKAGTEINLSSEYSIEEKITSFEWFKNNQSIQLSNPSNGIFIADTQYVGDTLVSKIKNESFPDLILEYKVNITENEDLRPITPILGIYPNPATEYININLDDEEIQSVEIYSIEGLLLRKIKNTNKIPVFDLKNNFYILKIKTQKRTFTKKIIKQ